MTLSKVNIFSDIAQNVLLLVECLNTNKLKIDIPNNLIFGNAISKKKKKLLIVFKMKMSLHKGIFCKDFFPRMRLSENSERFGIYFWNSTKSC